jgi:hypothetical protein
MHTYPYIYMCIHMHYFISLSLTYTQIPWFFFLSIFSQFSFSTPPQTCPFWPSKNFIISVIIVNCLHSVLALHLTYYLLLEISSQMQNSECILFLFHHTKSAIKGICVLKVSKVRLMVPLRIPTDPSRAYCRH